MPLSRIPDEFRTGWRILLACSIAAGTGITLVFLNFSMFILPLSQELGVSRGDLGSVQALIVTAALGAPIMGRYTGVKAGHAITNRLLRALFQCYFGTAGRSFCFDHPVL